MKQLTRHTLVDQVCVYQTSYLYTIGWTPVRTLQDVKVGGFKVDPWQMGHLENFKG